MARKPAPKEEIHHHKDGSLHARGQTIDGVLTGYWEWFRPDGTKKRSGSFLNGEQTGEWTTYDKEGKVFKVTKFGNNGLRFHPTLAGVRFGDSKRIGAIF